MTDESLNGLLDEKQVAKLLSVSVASLRRWRMMRKGPSFIRIGGLVRYHPSTIEQLLKSCSVDCQRGQYCRKLAPTHIC